MIIGSVPLYNVMAVVVLSFFKPERKKLDKEVWMTTLKGIVTNPIILGIIAGLVWSALKLPMPSILEKTVSDVGATATPLGLMAMGASFDLKKAFGKAKPAVTASVMKLVLFAALFLPLAVWMGFRREELVAILVMLSSATTVSCFVMARNMGHEGVLTSSVVHADNVVQCIYNDRMAVHTAEYGNGVISFSPVFPGDISLSCVDNYLAGLVYSCREIIRRSGACG